LDAVYKRKRDESTQQVKDFTVNVTNCSALPGIVAFVNAFIQKTMPGSSIKLVINGCGIAAISNPGPNLVYLAILVVLVPFILLGIIAIKLYNGYSWMSSLPGGVSWSFLNYNFSFGIGWQHNGSSESSYYSKTYSEGSKDYTKAHKLFDDFLGGNSLKIKSITAIFNPMLLRSFINQWELTTERMTTSPGVFNKITYGDNENQKWIKEKYNARTNALPWNKDLMCPILPTAHGTELFLAEKISQTGFANLSSLDAGFFGSGIYFSTFVMYTLPYFGSKKFPSVILSYVVPGNTYPVKEHHRAEDSLMGRPMQGGYNSHYVITDKNGNCIEKQRDGIFYDEVVIPNENQIVPAFIFEIDQSNFKELFDEWDRDVIDANNRDGRDGRDGGRDGRDGGRDGRGATGRDAGDRRDLIIDAQDNATDTVLVVDAGVEKKTEKSVQKSSQSKSEKSKAKSKTASKSKSKSGSQSGTHSGTSSGQTGSGSASETGSGSQNDSSFSSVDNKSEGSTSGDKKKDKK